MKTELEVARDAVRAALGDDVADALEWAAAAVKHRDTLLSAARWAATDSEAPCPDCGDYNLHARECPTANALHALDPEWSRQQVETAHADAPQWAPRRVRLSEDIARVGLASFEAMFGAAAVDGLNVMLRGAARLRPGELEAVADPDRLTYSAPSPVFGLASALPRRGALLSATLEGPPINAPNGSRITSQRQVHINGEAVTEVTTEDGLRWLMRLVGGVPQWEAVPAERADAGTTR